MFPEQGVVFLPVDFGKDVERPRGIKVGHIFSDKYLWGCNKKPLNNLSERKPPLCVLFYILEDLLITSALDLDR